MKAITERNEQISVSWEQPAVVSPPLVRVERHDWWEPYFARAVAWAIAIGCIGIAAMMMGAGV